MRGASRLGKDAPGLGAASAGLGGQVQEQEDNRAGGEQIPLSLPQLRRF
jgi:hypothetical protein